MSKNPLVASDLLLDGDVTEYGRHFGKNKCTRHKCKFYPIILKSHAADFIVFGLKEFVGDVRFYVQRPRDRIRRHFLKGKHEIL